MTVVDELVCLAAGLPSVSIASFHQGRSIRSVEFFLLGHLPDCFKAVVSIEIPLCIGFQVGVYVLVPAIAAWHPCSMAVDTQASLPCG
jgi:hypothetical protein